MSHPTDAELIDFVVREARVLDEHRFEDWLDLFTEDGHYWMPLEWGQTDPVLVGSLCTRTSCSCGSASTG
jgi:3-phenylpropionate/cinnamic acid dioxygenase small subunit